MVLGHAVVGFGHSDFRNRASCGFNSEDPNSSEDLENVPYTDPTDRQARSIMSSGQSVENMTAEDKLGFRVVFSRKKF
ncbi:M57 family metalloprotease [Aquimarina sp. RZ0]|uniref:M57 family metalloprotease n=1 Tax=Aquimarina sp. RZ0 TaxID=2607730 RepID=UPI0011F3BFE7|nr:hypothetical protein F0000_08390 [Aquimarina sp. RZ0]